MKAELENLVALQKTDTVIRLLNNSINTVTERRVAIEQKFEARAFEIRVLQKTREDANAEKLKLETEITDAKTLLERAERNLKNSQNSKEYEAAMREKSVVEKQIGELETKLTEKLVAVEEAEKGLAERASEIATIETERTKTLKSFDSEFEKEKKQLATEQKHRAETFKTLPKNLAGNYDRLQKRIRDGIAVAEVRNGACSACSMRLRPQLFVDIKMGGNVISCENCSRILYYIPTEEPEQAAAKK